MRASERGKGGGLTQCAKEENIATELTEAQQQA